jgi:hypothetical protein
MDPKTADALLKLFAAGAVGFIFQWMMFGPAKVKWYFSWPALAAATVLIYWWATPTFVADFHANWRFFIVGIISFFLTAKGTGSTAANAKVAPKSNSL